jgi:hypothetical protein
MQDRAGGARHCEECKYGRRADQALIFKTNEENKI